MGKGAGRTEELCQVLGGSMNVGVPENLESAVCALTSDLMSLPAGEEERVSAFFFFFVFFLHLRELCVCVFEGSP